MKDSIIEILGFLFDKYVERKAENIGLDDKAALASLDSLSDEVVQQLLQRGFTMKEIYEALVWFVDLVMQRVEQIRMERNAPVRVFAADEVAKIDQDGRNLLLFLERVGLLGVKTREIVIDQLMHLSKFQCSVEEIKSVVTSLLMNNDEKKIDKQLLEKYVLCFGQQYKC